MHTNLNSLDDTNVIVKYVISDFDLLNIKPEIKTTARQAPREALSCQTNNRVSISFILTLSYTV